LGNIWPEETQGGATFFTPPAKDGLVIGKYLATHSSQKRHRQQSNPVAEFLLCKTTKEVTESKTMTTTNAPLFCQSVKKEINKKNGGLKISRSM
jgi:hypothetical protein